MLSSDEYRAVFESAPDGVLVVGDGGTILDLNPQAEEMFGYPREELLGEPVEILVPEAFRRAHEEHRARFLRRPHLRPMGVGMELSGRRRDGSEFALEISLSPWRAGAGKDELRVICTVRDVTARRRLRDFSEGALRSVEEERQRIARELHDDTAQRLATLMLRLRVLSLVTDEGERRNLIEELRGEILEATEGVKRIARGLRPPELEDVGLASALRAHVRGLRESGVLDVEAVIDEIDPLLDDARKLTLYRVVQESLSNVVRHAGVDRARLEVRADSGVVRAVVEDRGRGFTEARAAEGGGGLGLVGMQERAQMSGGSVVIDSRPGEGTRVTLELPATTTVEETQHA